MEAVHTSLPIGFGTYLRANASCTLTSGLALQTALETQPESGLGAGVVRAAGAGSIAVD